MGDGVSDRDRALIDAAVAAGRVRKIPYGVRSVSLDDFVYDEHLGKLRHADKELAAKRYKRGLKFGRGK